MDPKVKEIKLKMSSQLTDDDKKYILENPTAFDDEDRAAWGDALSTPDSGEGGADDAGAGDGSDDLGTGTGDPNPAPSPTPDPPTPPAEPAQPATPSGGYTFKSEEEARAFVKEEFDRQKQAAIDAAKTPEEKKWVEDNWKPKTWNEGIKTAAEAAADIVEERQKLRDQQIEAHNKKVEADWQALRTEHKLADIDTDEGRKVHDAIIDIGVKFGKKNFKDAYEVYLMVPRDKGGGYDPAPGAAPTPTPSEAAAILARQKADKLKDQKKVAAKVGGQNPGSELPKGGSGALQPISYEDLKSKSRSKLLKEALNG